MTRKTALALLAAAGAAIGFGMSPADAAVGPECVGDNIAAVCVTVDPAGLPSVNPTGGPGIHDCVFVGPPPCKPVDVPTPSVVPGSDPWVVEIDCGGTAIECVPIDLP